ncbi:hypothetical protein [Sorangium cellulosum]|nr:hypothetical protein [Sorangium cellulosum]
MARAFVPESRSVEALGWIDSQVTKIERRLDKALRLRVDGEPRVLHVEFCFALRDDVPDRVFEYLGFLFAALRAEAPGESVPPIESVAVVLSGRRRRLPAIGKRRTAWPGRRFSGTHFRIDAVYQRTVAELRARGSVFWLVFAPLARDATLAGMREVLAEIHARAANYAERVDFITAFWEMASVDPWGHNLRKELTKMLTREMEEEMIRSLPGIEKIAVAVFRKELEQAIKPEDVRQGVIQDMRQEVMQEVRQEVMQEVRQEVMQEVRREAKQEVMREAKQEVMREAKQEVMREAKQEVMREAKQEVMREAKQEALLELLGRLFARRVGRRPTTDEERSMVERAKTIGAGEVEDALLDLEGEALVRWLAEPARR